MPDSKARETGNAIPKEAKVRRKLVAGNWKMNGTGGSLDEAKEVARATLSPDAELLICPPFTLISQMHKLLRETHVAVGGQDCHTNASGAHTGDTSAEMLVDAGATHVIVGHSERRQLHGETDELVRQKAAAAWRAGLVAIVCIGETESTRDAGRKIEIVRGQIADGVPDGATAENTVIAYEPVWAIGTGKTPSGAEIAEVHDFIRTELTKRTGEMVGNGIRIIYGGSVNLGNAAEIFRISNVNGALVGGASLRVTDFLAIADCVTC